MSSGNFRINARVPVAVMATDAEIFCNSTKGYQLFLEDQETGERKLLEEHRGAVKKPNPHTRSITEKWVIVAL